MRFPIVFCNGTRKSPRSDWAPNTSADFCWSPGESQQVFPGDRVYEGVGPIEVDWDTFIPVLVEGLGEVAYATAYYWQGDFCHTEAGRKWVH